MLSAENIATVKNSVAEDPKLSICRRPHSYIPKIMHQIFCLNSRYCFFSSGDEMVTFSPTTEDSIRITIPDIVSKFEYLFLKVISLQINR